MKPALKIVIGIPGGSTPVDKRSIRDSASHAGAHDIYMIYEPMASALGIGLDVEAPNGNMVIDIGGGTTDLSPEDGPEDFHVIGRNMITAHPAEAFISYKEIALCIDKTIVKIESEIIKVLQRIEPEVYSNIVQNGIWLAGGGSLLRGIARRFTDKVNIPFRVAEDPLKAVARGTCLALKGTDRYQFFER